jgi:hypothetical protein
MIRKSLYFAFYFVIECEDEDIVGPREDLSSRQSDYLLVKWLLVLTADMN